MKAWNQLWSTCITALLQVTTLYVKTPHQMHLQSQGLVVCLDYMTRMGKLHAWRKFLAKYGDKYAIDTFFTDYYGYNSTSHLDGFVRRMK